MNEKLLNEINLLPNKPGCYLMHDADDNIIYVGKAKNLKNRVSQYFNRPHTGKTAAMVSHVDHFEIIITRTEKEAFILESNLIQKHLPRYNILLKDDKHYPYIAIHKVKDPYISIARNLNDKKCDYFGPFPESSNAYEMINILNKFYPLRKCHQVPKTPCLYYHLGQCLAPCINKIKNEQYQTVIDEIKQFLKGDNKKVLQEVKEKIKESSEKLDFETAVEYKKILDSLNHINDKQNVELISNDDVDVYGYFIREGYISLAILIIRKGILIAKKNYVYELVGEIEDFLSGIIFQYYQHNLMPKEIVVGNKEIKESLESLFQVNVTNPTKGKLFDLINVAQINAKEGLDEHFMSARLDDDKLKILEDLGNLLNIKTPYRIELFDNSHLQGTNAIGAMVCFINGEPNKKMYRKFNIESENKKDDLSSMKEVLTRRYTRIKEENQTFPDLILLDGGLEQIEIAKEVMKNLNLKINIAGLAKSEKHRTNSLITSDGEAIDLNQNKPLFFLLTRMQDEVHRYAISTHRNKRNKSMFASVFDDIPGLGEKRTELLIKTYPTIAELNNVSLIELEQIIPKESAIALYNKLRGKKDEQKD
jgi:excinuclease ABC subunit C